MTTTLSITTHKSSSAFNAVVVDNMITSTCFDLVSALQAVIATTPSSCAAHVEVGTAHVEVVVRSLDGEGALYFSSSYNEVVELSTVVKGSSSMPCNTRWFCASMTLRRDRVVAHREKRVSHHQRHVTTCRN